MHRNVMLDWEQLPNKKFPMIFHAVYGKDEREEHSPSFFNIPEVETVERYLKMLLDDNVRSRRLKHLKPEMIGIISPYKRQVSRSCSRIYSHDIKTSDNIKAGLECQRPSWSENLKFSSHSVIAMSFALLLRAETIMIDKEDSEMGLQLLC